MSPVRSLVLEGRRHLVVQRRSRRPLEPREVRVAVRAAGICGSDVHGYRGDNDRRAPGVVMGHEAVGEVVELGDGVDGPAPGTLVAVDPVRSCGACARCRAGEDNLCGQRRLYGCVPDLPGAFAEEIVVPAANAVAFPPGVPVAWGALVEPLAVGVHAVLLARLGPADRVLVVGGGPIGLAVALAARRAGVGALAVAEPVAARRAVLPRLGLEGFDPLAAPAAPASFDVVLDCVASAATLSGALAAVVPTGRVVLVGLGVETLPVHLTPLVMGERVLQGSAQYTRADFADTAAWVGSGTVDLDPLIGRCTTLEDAPGAFEAYAEGRETALKVLVEP